MSVEKTLLTIKKNKYENNIINYNERLAYYNKYPNQYSNSIIEYEKLKKIDMQKLKEIKCYELSKEIRVDIENKSVTTSELMMELIIKQNKRIEDLEISNNYILFLIIFSYIFFLIKL